eukprot:EG_transcript_48119
MWRLGLRQLILLLLASSLLLCEGEVRNDENTKPSPFLHRHGRRLLQSDTNQSTLTTPGLLWVPSGGNVSLAPLYVMGSAGNGTVVATLTTSAGSVTAVNSSGQLLS